jgi:hypothetical protein
MFLEILKYFCDFRMLVFVNSVVRLRRRLFEDDLIT